MKQWFTNLFSFHFQTKDSDMHAYVHSWSPNDGDRNQQNNKLLGLFFYRRELLQWLKATNETTTLLTHFIYNMTLC